MPRFVILEHQREGEETHWDLMLEKGDTLKTFRLNRPPGMISMDLTEAEPICDHDLRFLTYEGQVNNGKGSVRRIDAGVYENRSRDSLHWKLVLQGKTLRGQFALTRRGTDSESWEFVALPAV